MPDPTTYTREQLVGLYKLAQTQQEKEAILYELASPEERAQIDLLNRPSLTELESDWRIWLKTLFPQFMRGPLAPYHEEYLDWLWATLWAKRKNEPLPDGTGFFSIWGRGCSKSTMARLAPIAEACLLGKGYSLYVSGSQDQANKHLASIETLLTSDMVRYYYPQMSKPRKGDTDKNRAWNQKMLYLASGFVLQAIGLDVGIRGANIDDMRVTQMIIDDIDDRSDTALQSEQKMDKFLHSVLPTKKPGTIFICAQNLVLESGVIYRLFTGDVPALVNSHVSGPHPRVADLKIEQQERNGRQLDIIVGGTCTWPADSIENCQEDIFTFTLPVFRRECNNELLVDRTGLVLSRWEDGCHVITEKEFQAVFGYRVPPPHWNKYMVEDWAQTKSAWHANVVLKVAVSNQNEPLPGFLFIYDAMSFEAGTQADDVAVRMLRSISPTVEVRGQTKTWDDVLESELQRTNLHEFISSATNLIEARRATLARIIPDLVGPLLRKHRFKGLRMSHEAKDQRNIYRRVFGLGFTGINPRREGGVELINHYLQIDPSRKHPFKDQQGWARMFLIVPDEKKGYPIALRPDTLHDSDLVRYQFSHHRYAEPSLTTTGILERGPMKQNDDATNCLMMLFCDNHVIAQPLNQWEKVEELIPAASRLESIMKPSPTSLTGRMTMSPRDQLGYEMMREAARAQLGSSSEQWDEYLEPM